MNLKQLKEILNRPIYENREDEEYRVGIAVATAGSVGGTPVVGVKSVQYGFDWDSGKLIIYPEQDLREISRDEIKALRDKYSELSWKHYEISNLKRENQRLKEKLRQYEEKSGNQAQTNTAKVFVLPVRPKGDNENS
jgi:hypothetical protein